MYPRTPRTGVGFALPARRTRSAHLGMNDLGFSVVFAAFFVMVTVWQSWAWALLLVCFPLGMLLRRRLPRARAMVIGGSAALVFLAANTGVLAATLNTDPAFAAGIYPPYVFGLILALCWLAHTFLALLVLATGCLLTEAILRATRQPAARTAVHRRRKTSRR